MTLPPTVRLLLRYLALAYVVMAAGLFALAKTSPAVDYSAHPEVPVAAPAE